MTARTLGDDFFHTDTADLEDGLGQAIDYYAERVWTRCPSCSPMTTKED